MVILNDIKVELPNIFPLKPTDEEEFYSKSEVEVAIEKSHKIKAQWVASCVQKNVKDKSKLDLHIQISFGKYGERIVLKNGDQIIGDREFRVGIL